MNHFISRTFVNGQYTADGGTHVQAFREALVKALNDVKVNDPIFESQTKNKLGNSDIKSSLVQEMKGTIVDILYKNPEISQTILNRIQFNEKLRKELHSLKRSRKGLF
ncbi:hypothetical protein ACTFIW_000867 [Dictyostelium discoideum]